MESYDLNPVGRIESPLTALDSAPRQADEGAPQAWLVFDPDVRAGLEGLRVGDDVLVFTWLHHANRNVLNVHPRGDPARPMQGVFSTRSPHRPNPIGLHRVIILAIADERVLVNSIEAVDGTPIIDIKPVLECDTSLR